MKETKQLYVFGKPKDGVLFTSTKNNSKFEVNNYFITMDLKKEYYGFYSVGFLHFKDNLNLKQFKIEISEIRYV